MLLILPKITFDIKKSNGKTPSVHIFQWFVAQSHDLMLLLLFILFHPKLKILPNFHKNLSKFLQKYQIFMQNQKAYKI
jgi:hypothetical protein